MSDDHIIAALAQNTGRDEEEIREVLEGAGYVPPENLYEDDQSDYFTDADDYPAWTPEQLQEAREEAAADLQELRQVAEDSFAAEFEDTVEVAEDDVGRPLTRAERAEAEELEREGVTWGREALGLRSYSEMAEDEVDAHMAERVRDLRAGANPSAGPPEYDLNNSNKHVAEQELNRYMADCARDGESLNLSRGEDGDWTIGANEGWTE